MTITWLQLLTFILANSIFVLTPGPGVFAAIAKGMAQGARPVLPLAVGMALGDTVYMFFSAYGLSVIATNFGLLFSLIRYVGAAYLLYLAWKLWTTKPQTEQPQTAPRKRDSLSGFISGFLISISNPKVILFYISLLPSFFPVTTLGDVDIVIICTIVFVVVTTWIMAYGVIAGYAQKQLRNPTSRLRFNRASATLMGAAGAWLLAKG